MRPQRGERQDFAPQNLLPSLLQFVAGMPFVSIDWYPRAKVRTPRPFLLAREYEEQNVAAPFNLQDWSRRPRSGIREEVAQHNLISYLTYNYGRPFSMHEWSTRSRAHLRQDFMLQNLSALQTIDYGKPFHLADWPSRQRVHAREDFAQQNLMDLLTAVIQRPFFVTDLPGRSRVHVRQDVAPQNLLGLLTQVIEKPFFVTDWMATRRGQGRSVDADQSMLALRMALAASPFAQLDWNYPEFRFTPKPQWDVHLLQTVHVKPFAQHDWSVRDRVRQPAREQTWDYGLDFVLFQFAALRNMVDVALHVAPLNTRELSATVRTDHTVHVAPHTERTVRV
jgi:hypothetical protein